MNPNIQRITLTPSQSLNVSNVAFTSAGGAVQLCTPNDKRQFIVIENTGLSNLWIGASNNVTTGATGTAIGTVATAATKTIQSYGGALWGIFNGVSHATGHVVKVWEY